MSVSEGLSEAEIGGRRPGGVLIFRSVADCHSGSGGDLPRPGRQPSAHASSGYGIDERITGAIPAAETDGGVITFAR